jgi:hypothetical protein
MPRMPKEMKQNEDGVWVVSQEAQPIIIEIVDEILNTGKYFTASEKANPALKEKRLAKGS